MLGLQQPLRELADDLILSQTDRVCMPGLSCQQAYIRHSAIGRVEG